MHISDVALECAQECARLSRECGDRKIGIALYKISVRLASAVTQDSELQWNDAQDTSQSATQADTQSHASDVETPHIMPCKAQR